LIARPGRRLPVAVGGGVLNGSYDGRAGGGSVLDE
jgi:hypothetical protein